jgi:hypothetical protein
MSAENKTEQTKKKSHWGIKKFLDQHSANELLALIGELYVISKENKCFLEARFLHDDQALEKYKAQIKDYLAPKQPWNNEISLKYAKKVFSDYKKATKNQIAIIDLMVYYVECGTDFLCEFGDMYEQYYASLESVFDNAVKIMKKHDINDIQNLSIV